MEDAVAAAWHMNQLKYEGEDITKEKLAGLSIVPLLEAEKSPTNRRITNIIDQFRTLTTLYFTPRSVYHFDAHLAQSPLARVNQQYFKPILRENLAKLAPDGVLP